MCILMLSFAQCALEIVSELHAGSVPAESMGKHEVGGVMHGNKTVKSS